MVSKRSINCPPPPAARVSRTRQNRKLHSKEINKPPPPRLNFLGTPVTPIVRTLTVFYLKVLTS